MQKILVLLIVITSCINLQKEESYKITNWELFEWNSNIQEYTKKSSIIDTLNILNGIVINDYEITYNILDSLLAKDSVNYEYFLDNYTVWYRPSLAIFKDSVSLELQDIFISNSENNELVNILYSKNYGTLVMNYSYHKILVANKICIFKNGQVQNEMEFDKLNEIILNDSIFPKPPPPLPPSEL